MRVRILSMIVLLVVAAVFISAPTKAQPVSPLALGALGAAAGYVVGGDPQGAAIGAAAGITTGLLINAGQYGHGQYGYRGRYYGPPARYAPGRYSRWGYYAPRHHPPRRWGHGHYNRWGKWVPNYPGNYYRGWGCASVYCR